MFGTFRKHQTWLWVVIIVVIVISFVIYFSPYSRLNNATRRMPVNLGSINGERITEEQFVHARSEVYLRYFFMTGNWPNDEALKQGGQVERDTYQWLLLIQKQDQMGIRFSPAVACR